MDIINRFFKESLMKTMTRILVVLLCFIAAIACYGFGFQQGGVFFIGLGFVFEGLAWFGIFKPKKKNNVT